MRTVTVPRLWPGSTIVCIASGPSLTQDDVDFVRGKTRVIVVNNTHERAPWADVLWATDWDWWTHHQGVPSFRGLKFSLQADGGTADFPDVQIVKNACRPGLSLDPASVSNGLHGGYAAVNLAVHLGASRIVLLGYDCQAGPKGDKHWHDDHPKAIEKSMLFERWLGYFATMVAPLQAIGVEVVNCTRETALTCFQRRSLAEALAHESLEMAS